MGVSNAFLMWVYGNATSIAACIMLEENAKNCDENCKEFTSNVIVARLLQVYKGYRIQNLS